MLPKYDPEELEIAQDQALEKGQRERRRAKRRVDCCFLLYFVNKEQADWENWYDWGNFPYNWRLAHRAYFCSNRCSCGRALRIAKHQRLKRMRRWKQERNL